MTMNTDQHDAMQTPAEYQKPDVFPVATVKEIVSFRKTFARTEALYAEAKEEFHATELRDPDIVKRGEKWAKASRTMIMAGAALFGLRADDLDEKEKALEVLDLCKKDAGIRAYNLDLHYQIVKQNGSDEDKKEDPRSLRDKVLNAYEFYYRALNTHQRYADIYVNDPKYVTPELASEKRAGVRVAEKIKMVPKGHYFLPARPFPPMRIPEGEEVPYPPEAYLKWKSLPVKDYYYDTEHDEFALPKGYLSEDGTIDDQSVVWDWVNNTVTMKFVGGEPVTWPFWKAKDTSDTMKPGTWCREYYIRLYRRWLRDIEPPGTYEL